MRSWSRSAWKRRDRARAGATLIAIVVPYRPQREQDRAAQLDAFLRHMAAFVAGSGGARHGVPSLTIGAGRTAAPGVRFVVIVAQQSDDGRKFNRGQLLNAGYREAQRVAGPGGLASIILHDVDLLPPAGLRPWYAAAPKRHAPVHLAGSGWGKYDMPGYDFFGGVTAFHPCDFDACNGFPNDYWGWGMEDDQLRLRASASGASSKGVVRPPASAGRYQDLDTMAVLRDVLCSADKAMASAHLINAQFLQPNRLLGLDLDWEGRNGLRGLCSTVLQRSVTPLVRVTAVGDVCAAGAAGGHAGSDDPAVRQGGARVATEAEEVARGPNHAVGAGMSRGGECAGGGCWLGTETPHHLHVHILVQLA